MFLEQRPHQSGFSVGASLVNDQQIPDAQHMTYLEDTILHIELRHAVLVHERRQHCVGCARLSHNCNGHRRADAILSLLHLQVVEKRGEHVLRGQEEDREQGSW